MNRVVRIIGVLLIYLINVSLEAAERKSPEYLKYAWEVTKPFIKEMEKKHNLICTGDGGHLAHDVEMINIFFTARRKASVEEARILEIDLIENLLQRVNSDEKIRPYLRESPFPSHRVGMNVSFVSKEGKSPLDGSVACVCTGKGKIHYDKAMMVMERWGPVYDARQDLHNPVCIEPARDVLVEDLRPIFSEPYEEALKLVKGTQEKSNPPNTEK